jgi:hypothetical protein
MDDCLIEFAFGRISSRRRCSSLSDIGERGAIWALGTCRSALSGMDENSALSGSSSHAPLLANAFIWVLSAAHFKARKQLIDGSDRWLN